MIFIRTKERMPILALWRLVLKFIFDLRNCEYGTQNKIENNIENWYNWVQLQKNKIEGKYGFSSFSKAEVGKKGTEVDEVEYQIQYMSKYLVMNEKGELDSKKETYKRHNIDYRKTREFGWAFMELRDPKDYYKAAEALKKCMRENPEDYN